MIRTICFRRRSKFKMWFLTVTGESTRWTFDSSTRISRALEHKALTSDSLMISQRRSCSICRSKSLISRQNLIQRPRIIFFKFDKRQLMKDRSVSTNFSFLLWKNCNYKVQFYKNPNTTWWKMAKYFLCFFVDL